MDEGVDAAAFRRLEDVEQAEQVRLVDLPRVRLARVGAVGGEKEDCLELEVGEEPRDRLPIADVTGHHVRGREPDKTPRHERLQDDAVGILP